MREVASFKWYDCGYAVAESTELGLKLLFSNLELEVGGRELNFKGVFEGVREHNIDSKGTRKVVYVDLAFPLKGLDRASGSVFYKQAEISLGAFGLIFSPLEPAGSYITIYPPPGSLYDYLVVAPDKVAIFTIGRRQVYLMEDTGGLKRIIMV